MSVATFNETPWIANVYFVHDEELHLYFLSKSTREHCQAIDKNAHVAVAITDSHQPINKPQLGLQVYGTAQKVNMLEKIEWMFKMWNTLVAGQSDERLENPKAFLEAGRSTIYKITPHRIKFFNTKLWPDEQTKVWERE